MENRLSLPGSGLLLAVAVSTLLHGALLLYLPTDNNLIHLSSAPNGNHIQVSFAQVHVSQAKAVTKSQPGSKPVNQQNRHTGITRNSHEPVTTEKSMETPSTARKLSSVESDNNQYEKPDSTSNDMIRQLEHEFLTRFQYPILARKRGWQGKVVIALDINQSGIINNVNVRESSGYPVLDRNAIRTFEKIGKITTRFNQVRSQTRQFTIPVIYKLTRG